MKLLLSSNSTSFGSPYLSACGTEVVAFLKENNASNIVFVPYAGVDLGYDEYTNMVRKGLHSDALFIHNIDEQSDKIAAIQAADAIIVGGGNTFHLTGKLYEYGLMEAIRNRVRNGGLYIGWSAGSNVAGPSIKTTNDMPITQPTSFDALHLIPFQINPHYTEKTIPGHNGESRDQRLKEFLHLHPNQKVVAMEEGSILLITDKSMRLIGSNPKIKVFSKSTVPIEYRINDDINFLLD